MLSRKDEIIKRNIDFIYGKADKAEIADPDKISYTKSHKFDAKANDIDDLSLTGDFGFLAPLYLCPVMLPNDVNVYPSMEHALQASKTSDLDKRLLLAAMTDTRELKKMGSKWADDLVAWRTRAIDIADCLLRDKFVRNKDIREKLISTKNRGIVFKNDFGDQYWGITIEGKGQNMLGKALERVRLLVERGGDTTKWLQGLFSLHDADNVLIAMLIKRGSEVVQEVEVQNKSILHVGKTPDNEILCENPSVSRKHAVVVADRAQGLVLVDLGSANKTFVNNTALVAYVPMVLGKKDVVRFGSSSRSYQFMLECDAIERNRQQLYDKVANPTEDNNRRSSAGKELTVFVGNLSYSAQEADVREFFDSCGAISSLSLPKDKVSGEGHRGIAFVEFANTAGLTRALMRNGDELQERALKIVRQSSNSTSSGKDKNSNSSQQRNKSKDYAMGPDSESSYYTRAPGAPPAASQSVQPQNTTRELSPIASTTRTTEPDDIIPARHGRDSQPRRDDRRGGRSESDRGRAEHSRRSHSRDDSRDRHKSQHRRKRSRSSSSNSSGGSRRGRRGSNYRGDSSSKGGGSSSSSARDSHRRHRNDRDGRDRSRGRKRRSRSGSA